MASEKTIVDFILKQVSDAGTITAKKMFGEYGIFYEGKIVALVCDNQLFVKPTLAGEKVLGQPIQKVPYPGAKPCFLISSEQYKDRTWLSQLIKLTAAELSRPKHRQ